ncbi:MAG TPA: chemotaxis protein CheA [bacterium]|nr:chemotaxis protein CheA [bacterium]
MNTSDYKELFLSEAREYLSNLNNSLVQLEKDPAQGEPIKEVFRSAHTLKGMAATMGYEPMVRLTHEMESVLDPIRSGKEELSTRLMDALFLCLDQLEKWVDALSRQDFIEEESLEEAMKVLRRGASEGEPGRAESAAPLPAFQFSAEETEILSQAKRNGFSILQVAVQLVPECQFKEVRAFMVLKAINGLGEIVHSEPSPEEIEKGLFKDRFLLVVVTDCSAERIRDGLTGIGEVASVRIDEFKMGPTGKKEPATEPGHASPLAAENGKGDVEERSSLLPTVRVHTTKLDKLMALVQELVISKIRFEQIASTQSLKELDGPLSQLHHVTDELQDEIMKVRLMPVKQIFDRFPRMVRDLAKGLGKQVDLEMDGGEVELDRTVLEEMSEPLVHLLRNAVDHGIEVPDFRVQEGKEPMGTIRLQARRERAYVVITISDDGRGIDPDQVRQKSVAKGLLTPEDAARLTDEESIRLIALPGFSTLDNATRISGRGVGVDVAKTKVEALGGTLRIQSKKSVGTSFILRFPLTLAIIKALMVRCAGEVFAVPVTNIIETLDVPLSDKKDIQQRQALILREDVVPYYPLAELLEMEGDPGDDPSGLETVLIAEVGDSRVGLKVDEVIGQQEIAIKPMDPLLKGIRGFSGATILGNGKIALILDVNGLVEDFKDKRFQVDHSDVEKDLTHAPQS